MRSISTLLWLAAVALVSNRPTIADAANNCADPYWQDSLRCVDAGDSNLVPQPAPEQPLVPSDIKDFTRVDLDSDPQLRCLDGTVPIVYVDAAADGNDADWLISLTGGGHCNAKFDEVDALTDGQYCLDTYMTHERSEMGTSNEPAMKNLGTGAGAGSKGIHSPDLITNPVFANFNRVRVEKCSYDRHDGRRRTVHAVHPLHGEVSYDLHQQGQLIVREAIQALLPGLDYHLFQPDGDGGVLKIEGGATLPPLEVAQRVLFLGHSGAGHGLMHNIDRLADTVRTGAFSGDIRFVMDANFLVALENEAAFNEPAPTGDIYDFITSGQSSVVAPVTGNYDPSLYADPTSFYRENYASYLRDTDGPGDMFDASCVAAHPGSVSRCVDRFHVLFNHITTPMFIREDFTDSSHVMNGTGHRVEWGEASNYPECPSSQVDCPPVITLPDHRVRLLEQQERLATDAPTRSELATGPGGVPLDSSGPVPTRFIWMPDCGSHPGVYESDAFQETWIARAGQTINARQLLEAFMNAPAGTTQRWVDGLDSAFSICPGEPGAPPPSVPDGVRGMPLLVDKRSVSGDRLRIFWDVELCTVTDHHLLVGGGTTLPATLGDPYGLLGSVCNVGSTAPFDWIGVPEANVDPSLMLWWVMVADDDVDREGAWGRNSRGDERNAVVASGECGMTVKDLGNTCGR